MTTKTGSHTPGEWKALHDFDGDYAIFGGLSGKVHIATTNADYPEDQANACLIAAAPQMLEALELLVNNEPLTALSQSERHRIIGLADEAIRSAQGES